MPLVALLRSVYSENFVFTQGLRINGLSQRPSDKETGVLARFRRVFNILIDESQDFSSESEYQNINRN